MSRIRSVKPEFWTSHQVLECSTNARLLFIGLWNFCDDEGRHPWSAKQCKAEVFPADDFTEQQIDGMLLELSKNGLIVGYSFEDKNYFYVSGWKHQRIDKPQPPKYPDPFSDNSTTIPRPFPPDTIRYDTIGEEGNGYIPPAAEEKKKPTEKRKKQPIPEGWSPPVRSFDLAKRLGVNVPDCEGRFRDYLASTGKLYLDYDAAFCNFVRNAPKYNPEVRTNGATKSLTAAADRALATIETFSRTPEICGGEGATFVQLLPKK